MLIVSGSLTFDPPDRDAAVELIAAVTEATRAEEGNLTYGMYEDTQERGSFQIYEEWADDDALALHMATPHMAEFLAAAGGLKILGMSIFSHEVTKSTKVM